jgi:amino acid efflux transporter
MPRWMARPGAPLTVFAATAALILALLAPGVADVEPFIRASSSCFVAVYVAATAAGTRLLAGRVRVAAAVSFALVLVVFAFSGAYLVAPATAALLAAGFTSGGAVWRGLRGEPDCRTAS